MGTRDNHFFREKSLFSLTSYRSLKNSVCQECMTITCENFHLLFHKLKLCKRKKPGTNILQNFFFLSLETIYQCFSKLVVIKENHLTHIIILYHSKHPFNGITIVHKHAPFSILAILCFIFPYSLHSRTYQCTSTLQPVVKMMARYTFCYVYINIIQNRCHLMIGIYKELQKTF